MTPEQWYLGLQLLIKLLGGFGWDKHPRDRL